MNWQPLMETAGWQSLTDALGKYLVTATDEEVQIACDKCSEEFSDLLPRDELHALLTELFRQSIAKIPVRH